MLEPPALAPEVIRTALRAHFGVAVAALEFLPCGEDSSAWVYRAQTVEGVAYLVKVRRGQPNEAALAIPRYLQSHGVQHIVAPLPTETARLWVALDEFSLMLYPFVASRTAFEAGMSEGQWIEYGVAVRQIHATALSPDLQELMRREIYIPKSGQLIRDLDAHIALRSFEDPLEEALVAVWRARRVQIRTLVDRAEALGLRLQQKSLPLVLCHADIHTANVLLDADGRLWIVDWDEVLLAPKERDLMFVVGGLGSDWVKPQQTQWFLRGYGPAAVDSLALAYYRNDWAAQDISEYAARVLLRPELGTESKRDALHWFMSQFERGGMVELAEGSRWT